MVSGKIWRSEKKDVVRYERTPSREPTRGGRMHIPKDIACLYFAKTGKDDFTHKRPVSVGKFHHQCQHHRSWIRRDTQREETGTTIFYCCPSSHFRQHLRLSSLFASCKECVSLHHHRDQIYHTNGTCGPCCHHFAPRGGLSPHLPHSPVFYCPILLFEVVVTCRPHFMASFVAFGVFTLICREETYLHPASALMPVAYRLS